MNRRTQRHHEPRRVCRQLYSGRSAAPEASAGCERVENSKELPCGRHDGRFGGLPAFSSRMRNALKAVYRREAWLTAAAGAVVRIAPPPGGEADRSQNQRHRHCRGQAQRPAAPRGFERRSVHWSSPSAERTPSGSTGVASGSPSLSSSARLPRRLQQVSLFSTKQSQNRHVSTGMVAWPVQKLSPAPP